MSKCTQLSDHTWNDSKMVLFYNTHNLDFHYPLNVQIEEFKYI